MRHWRSVDVFEAGDRVPAMEPGWSAVSGQQPCCPMCGGPSLGLGLRRQGYEYLRCGCGAMWLWPRDEPETVFDHEYFEGGKIGGYSNYLRDEELHRRTARIRLELLRRHGRVASGKLLDIGCATGFLLDEARRQGFFPVGVELSSWAAQQARDRFGLTVFSRVEDLPEHSSFDVVTMFQLVMHVPEPAILLEQVHDRMRTGGRLVIETWDLGSPTAKLMRSHFTPIAPPSVLNLHDRASLQGALDRAGFRLLWSGATAKRVSLGFVLGLLAEKYPKLFTRASNMIGTSVLAGRGLPYFGGLLTMVAEAR